MASVDSSSSAAGSSRSQPVDEALRAVRAQHGPQPADGREQARLGGDAGVHQVLGVERGRPLPADVGEVPVAVAEVGRGGRVRPRPVRPRPPARTVGAVAGARPTGPARSTRRCSRGERGPPPAPGPPRPGPRPSSDHASTCNPRSEPSGAAATASKDARSVRNGPGRIGPRGAVRRVGHRLEARGEAALGVAPPHQGELEPTLGGHVAERRIGDGRRIGDRRRDRTNRRRPRPRGRVRPHRRAGPKVTTSATASASPKIARTPSGSRDERRRAR